MSDIYDLLSKHFLNEATPEEEMEVNAFKLSNTSEYEMLKTMWTAKGVNVSEFDQTAAWESIVKNSPNTKRQSSVFTLRRVAAIAAVFFVVSFVGTRYFLSQDKKIELTEVIGDGTKTGIELSDGSIVFLNKDAVLSYPNKFTGDYRLVNLEGEAYFEITPDEKRPFKITAQHANVEVLGTAFNMKSNRETTEVSVTSGTVKVTSVYNDQESTLTKNQSAIVSNQQFLTSEEQRANFLSWKTGAFVFKEMHIEALEIVKLTCNLQVNETNGFYELK